jgi:Integrase core domain
LTCKTVTRDYDGMFTTAFDQVFKDRSIQVTPVDPQAPNLNAFIERWIQSVQHETLDRFICFGKEYFDHIIASYCDYYHTCRPHQGIGNVLLPRRSDESLDVAVNIGASAGPLSLADIKCDSRLGGLLKHFYRVAA